MTATDAPSPGSNEAIDAGCRCPVLDNSHGWGFRKEGEFIISLGCPLHAPDVTTAARNSVGGIQ